MPRKLRGRPVSYGPAQLRALDTFLRGEYLMHLSGDSSALLEGEPFHEAGRAYFDPDDFHIAILDKFDYRVSPWQTSNALTKLGVRSVQRRFENGVRRRIKETPIPKGAECAKITPENVYHDPPWVSVSRGEEFLEFQRQFGLHGVCRATKRFVRDAIIGYPEPEWGRDRLLEVLDNSWDSDDLVASFHETLVVKPYPGIGGYAVQFRCTVFEYEHLPTALYPWFKWFYHEADDFDARGFLPKVLKLIEHTSDSGKIPALRA